MKPVLPRDVVEIALSDSEFDQVRAFLLESDFSNGSSNILELPLSEIGFSDGSAWAGRMMRRDSDRPGRWSTLER